MANMNSGFVGRGQHVHLFVIIISLLEGVSGYEPNIPQLCSPERMTLKPGINDVCTR